MKKIFFFWVFVLVVLLLLFEVKTSLAGISVYFDFQEGRVSEAYLKFTYEFGVQFGERIKQYKFLGEYTVKILEGIGEIKHQDRTEEELVIVALINEEKSPFIWVKVKELDGEEKIRTKAREFSERIFEKLRELESRKKRKVMATKIFRALGYYNLRVLFGAWGGLTKLFKRIYYIISSYSDSPESLSERISEKVGLLKD